MRKKFLLVLMILSIVGANIFAGGSSAPSQGDPKELRIMIRNIGMANTNDNIINRELEKRTGFKLDWVLGPSDGYAQVTNTIIASGDYPDAMEYQGTYPKGVLDLAEDGVIRPLDDLLRLYGSEFTPDIRPDWIWINHKDGKRYSIPCRYWNLGTNRAIVVRKDWMNKLGLQVPYNSEAFFNMLTTFAANAEKLVGPGKRIIPLGVASGMNFDTYFLDFLYSENEMITGWNWVDGKLVYMVNMPAYKNALQTYRKFYQAGLIEPEYPIVSSRDEYMNRIMGNQYFAFAWYSDAIDEAKNIQIAQIYNALPELRNNLELIPFFRDKNGGHRFAYQYHSTQQMVIFKKTPEEKAVNVMKLLNYMVSKNGSNLLELGIEGEHFTIDSSGKNIAKDLSAQEQAKLGIWNYEWCMKRTYLNKLSDYSMNWLTGEAGVAHSIMSPLSYGAAQLQYGSALTSLQNQYVLELVTKRDINFDTVFNEMVNTWNAQGGAQITKEMNDLYAGK